MSVVPRPGWAVGSPPPALEHHQHPDSQGCRGSAPRPADRSPRNARGKQNKNKPHAPLCSIAEFAVSRMDLRADLQLLHKTVDLQRHRPLHSDEDEGKVKPGGGHSSGKPSSPAEPSQLLLAFLSSCTFKPTILERQEYPNHDICVKMKGMQMFGFFLLGSGESLLL